MLVYLCLRRVLAVTHNLPSGPCPRSQGVRKATRSYTDLHRVRPNLLAGFQPTPTTPWELEIGVTYYRYYTWGVIHILPAVRGPRSYPVRNHTPCYTMLHPPGESRPGSLQGWMVRATPVGPFSCLPFFHPSTLPFSRSSPLRPLPKPFSGPSMKNRLFPEPRSTQSPPLTRRLPSRMYGIAHIRKAMPARHKAQPHPAASRP